MLLLALDVNLYPNYSTWRTDFIYLCFSIRYVVERMDGDLWEKVLTPENSIEGS
jgi:hypothetical protein